MKIVKQPKHKHITGKGFDQIKSPFDKLEIKLVKFCLCK
jgi:hypothetical protein